MLSKSIADKLDSYRAGHELSEEEIGLLRSACSTSEWMAAESARFRVLSNARGGLASCGGGGAEMQMPGTGGGGGSPNVIGFQRSPTEAEIATEYREEMLKRLEPVLQLANRARQEDGMIISFQLSGPDGFGRLSVASIDIMKKLA